MRRNSSRTQPVRRSSTQGRMADTPHGVHHPVQTVGRRKGLKRSVYYGILLYILRTEAERLTLEQQLWIGRYSSKLEEQELVRAGRFAESLLVDSKVQYFHVRDILRVRRSIPWIEPFTAPESVRIGKGYTDKGALRPLHEKGRTSGEVVVWDEDLRVFCPPNYKAKGEWITADEVVSLLGETVFSLVAMQSTLMTNSPLQILSQLQMFQSRRE